MLNVNRYLFLILASLLLSACASTPDYSVKAISEEPPKIPSNLYWDVQNAQQLPTCSKKIQVLGDFEDCYKEWLTNIPYVEQERCYRMKQLQQIVWVSSKGNQLVKLPHWCK